MYDSEKEEFGKLLMDLCLSVGRPFSAEMVRVFWEDLQRVPFAAIQRQATAIRTTGKKNFNSNDLRPPPEERAALGGPDNHAVLDKLTRAMCRIWDRLTPNQRALAQFHEFVWTNDRIAPRPVALIIKPDGEAPGHRITVFDADMMFDEPAAPKTVTVPREPGSDDDFDEAAAARALLNATGAADLLRP